jgi:hypothetical protein
MIELNSRERMLRTFDHQETDYVPCCPMSFTALRHRCNGDRYRVALAERAMGLDAMLFIPAASRRQRPDHPDLRGLPVRFHPDVTTREWREPVAGGSDILHKEMLTPAGKLTTSVRMSGDWPHDDHIPFVDDYQVPRAVEPLVTGPQDLDALRYLLLPPTAGDAEHYGMEARQAHAFADEHGLLLAGGWGVGLDMADWLCGIENLIILTMEQPSFVSELLQTIHAWNLQRMQVVLAGPVDLYIRRAWYEGCDFCTPRFFREVLVPQLKAEANLAHEHGARFGYICSSGITPMLDDYLEAGIDILIGIDPIQGTHTDLPLVKERLDGKVCLWGGVSGAVTVEQGSETEVRAAVAQAIDTLGPRGFVLSPVDNLTVDEPRTWHNLHVFIDEWKKRRRGG